jgi:hypothetical protein
MKYKERGGPDLGSMIDDLKAGNKQFAQMAVYWGLACNSLQAQVRALLALRERKGILELCEVRNEDMDEMRKMPVSGVPVYFSKYPDGITKMYPFPEQS